MKARIIFYCVVIAVLLATLAAIPSHATERRDPLLNQEALQASASGHTDFSANSAPSSRHGKKPRPAHKVQAQGTKDKTAAKNEPGNSKNSK